MIFLNLLIQKNDILDEDSVISEGNSTQNEQKLGEIPRKMFLTKAKPTVKEVNDTDFHEGP